MVMSRQQMRRARRRQAYQCVCPEIMEVRLLLAGAQPAISILPATVAEDASTVNVKLILDQPAVGAESIRVTVINGTAIYNQDYTTYGQIISFAPGQTTANVAFTILDDDLIEIDEVFSGYLSQPNGLTIDTARADITILDNDGLPAISINATTVNESAGTVTVPLTLDQPAAGGEQVRVTVINGSAIYNQDYTTFAQIISFAPGQTAADVVYTILDDDLAETDEIFSGYLSQPIGLKIANARADVTIEDDDRNSPLEVNNPLFNLALPSDIYINIGPYTDFSTALGDEQNIDWFAEPGKANAVTLAYAANEIVSHLSLASAPIALHVNEQPGQPGSSTGIFLLTQDDQSTLDHFGINVNFSKMDDQSFAVTYADGSIFLIGKQRIGVLYAAYSVLESLGFRWPDPTDTIVPSLPALPVIPELPIVETPTQQYRGFWTHGDSTDGVDDDTVVDANYLTWMARNRLNLAGAIPEAQSQKLGIANWGGGHHVIKDTLDSADLFALHPDWYAEINGVRTPILESDSTARYANPSFANDDMIDYVSEELLQRLADGDMQGIDLLNLWPSDSRSGYWWDTSAAAQVLGNNTDNLLHFYEGVAANLAQAYEDNQINRLVSIAGISYYLTWEPPTNLQVIAQLEDLDNYVHVFYLNERSYSEPISASPNASAKNAQIEQDIQAWNNLADLKYGVVEYYNYSIYSAVAVTDAEHFAQNFQYFKANAGSLVAYMHPNRNNAGPRRLTHTLTSKLSWTEYDHTTNQFAAQPAPPVTNQYFIDLFGSNAVQWQQVYDDVASVVSNVSEVMRYCRAVIFNEDIWATPPLSNPEMLAQLQNCRDGGEQQLQDLPFTTQFATSFIGVDDSLAMLATAEQDWQTLLQNVGAGPQRDRILQDIEWFAATKQRYELIGLGISYHLDSNSGSPERQAIVDSISTLVDQLVNSPVTDDTWSDVNQRALYSLYGRLEP